MVCTGIIHLAHQAIKTDGQIRHVAHILTIIIVFLTEPAVVTALMD